MENALDIIQDDIQGIVHLPSAPDDKESLRVESVAKMRAICSIIDLLPSTMSTEKTW